MRSSSIRTIIFILSLSIVGLSYGQLDISWSKNFGGSDRETTKDIIATRDGGCLVVGLTASDDHDFNQNRGSYDFFAIKLDTYGQVQWSNTYGGSGYDRCYTAKQLPDGGYVLCGSTGSSDGDVQFNHGGKDAWLVRLDPQGNLIWESTIGSAGDDEFTCILIEDDGMLLGGSSIDSSSNFWIVKINFQGLVTWEWKDDRNADQTLKGLVRNPNGFYTCVGEDNTNTSLGSYPRYGTLMVSLNDSGQFQWSKFLNNNNYGTTVNELQNSEDDGYIFYKSGRSSSISSLNDGIVELVKVDSTGNLIWQKEFYRGSSSTGYGLTPTADGGFLIADSQLPLMQNFANEDDGILMKFNNNGVLKQEKRFGGTDFDAFVKAVSTEDGGLVIAGYSSSTDGDLTTNYGSYDSWVLKLTELKGEISGKVTFDVNANCLEDSTDIAFPNVVVASVGISTGLVHYSSTTIDGLYQFKVDTVPQLLYLANVPDFFDASLCGQDSLIINISGANLIDTIDFNLESSMNCPIMSVDIGTSALRRCMNSQYTVSYENLGTVPIFGAYIEVHFDDNLQVNSSSLPWTSAQGNTYSFDIGNLDLFESGSFSVSVKVNCDSTFIGQVLCSEAHIFPDTICVSSSSWDGAEVEARAKCIGADAVEFQIENTSSIDMINPVAYTVLDDANFTLDSVITIQAGEVFTFQVPVVGICQEIRVNQPNNHPTRTFSSAKVSLCNQMGLIPPGPIEDLASVSFPNDEESDFHAVDCEEIRGAYDPNDKQVEPQGYGKQNLIENQQELEYKIRFQNTGNDTAFNVFIRDTISPHLDLASITVGASSHPYEFNYYENGMIQFTFNNIMLPDSFVDEAASHGFVQFKIKQKDGNSVNTKIRNNADIFFDFNLPIRTNTVFNTIGSYILDTVIYDYPNQIDEPSILLVFPNPSEDIVFFKLDSIVEKVTLELFNLEGRMVNQTIKFNQDRIQFSSDQLSDALYYFKLYVDDKYFSSGKLIFK